MDKDEAGGIVSFGYWVQQRRMALAGNGQHNMAEWLGVAAVALATINVVGGYLVTDRMLAMFKKKGG